MVEALFEAVVLLKEAVLGLTQGACLTCGAEPGCNIDCKGCVWVIRAKRFLTEESGPCADCGRSGGHEPSCMGELVRYLNGPAGGACDGQTEPPRSTGAYQYRNKRKVSVAETLFEALVATRDVLATFGKQVGFMPAQGGYSTTMTDGERRLAQAVSDIDMILQETRSAGLGS